MQSPYPPRPPYPPLPGPGPTESDRHLLAQPAQGPEGGRAIALLLARHWRATFDYAVICLASGEDSASMAAAAAFHRVLGRPTDDALRPQLLRAVRDTVKEWAADDGISVLLPELRKPTGGRGLRAARSATPERRRLAERAFRALPGASQCLLWHTEVEAEPISVPAGLLGVDPGTAAAALDQAREQFRAGCVRAHGELAPGKECRFYNRLLDVPIRRGGALLPDVQQHLMACRYCRHAAEQLSYFEGGLEELLAETVLGWGARRYLDSRPRRGGSRPSVPGRGPLRPDGSGRHRPGLSRSHTKAVAVGVGVAALALLATVLVSKGWTDDNGVPGPGATWGAQSGSSLHPSLPAEGTSAGHASAGHASTDGSPSPASAGRPVEIGHGRLRNPASGLCLDIGGGKAVPGAAAVLTGCSSAESQQWSYQADGLLRSGVDPTLCLDSGSAGQSVLLVGCLPHDADMRYDLTVRGELLLRDGKGLLVAPGTGAAAARVVITERDGSAGQRWVLDTGDGDAGGKDGKDGKDGDGGSQEGAHPERRAGSPDSTPNLPNLQPTPGSSEDGAPYEERFAQVGDDTAPPGRPAAPLDGVRTLPADVLGTVAAVADTAASTADTATSTVHTATTIAADASDAIN
ncbi:MULTISPECIES: RICIN domain-containing protein [unclassified Streptomyces]|uniref:RICIN domain-containing protein n=1 Tax=unclassified Streptomyces TaxID=2593676 RepID=UPI000FFF6152|nr:MULTISPECIES: RICIN domain-containing protein [unclassified Streptomyces]